MTASTPPEKAGPEAAESRRDATEAGPKAAESRPDTAESAPQAATSRPDAAESAPKAASSRSDTAEAAPKRRRPRGWIIATSLLTVALIAAVAVGIYLWNVTEKWEQRVDELTEVSYDLGEQLADERDTVTQRDDRIDLLSEQLSTVQQRLLDLAAQVARSGDDAVVTQQQITNLETLLDQAASVSNALQRCSESQEQLAVYLADAESYDPEEIVAYEASVVELCEAARASNEQLQEAISGL